MNAAGPWPYAAPVAGLVVPTMVTASALVLLGTIAIFLGPELGPACGWIGAGVFAVFTPVLYRSARGNELRRS